MARTRAASARTLRIVPPFESPRTASVFLVRTGVNPGVQLRLTFTIPPPRHGDIPGRKRDRIHLSRKDEMSITSQVGHPAGCCRSDERTLAHGSEPALNRTRPPADRFESADLD